MTVPRGTAPPSFIGITTRKYFSYALLISNTFIFTYIYSLKFNLAITLESRKMNATNINKKISTRVFKKCFSTPRGVYFLRADLVNY